MKTKRRAGELRVVKIEAFKSAAAGSVLISQGNTRVLCTASVEGELPEWMRPRDGSKPKKGWVTAEYAMLPGSTKYRKKRGQDSRGTEIQRFIGRTLRSAVDLGKMPGVMISCDCDVVEADGGTRTASITGAFVALAQAVRWARKEGLIKKDPMVGQVAAVSVGIVGGKKYLDLDYELDVNADVDMNVAMNDRGDFVEVQGTAEGAAFSRGELNGMLDLAAGGIRELMVEQRRFLKEIARG